jgi:hypothetical protein
MHDDTVVARRISPWCIGGAALFSAFVATWFVWGPLGLIFYVGGLFNSLSVFLLTLPFVLLIPLGIIFLPVLAGYTVTRWRRLSNRGKVFSALFTVALLANATSLGLGLAGVGSSPFDMFVRGFTRYAKSRTDVAAIRTWLGTLDPNEYTVEEVGSDGMPLPATMYAPAIAHLNPRRHHVGVLVGQDDAGKLRVRLMWGGGFIGHWGIEVRDKSVQPPPDSEGAGHRPLAPGAWIWYGN